MASEVLSETSDYICTISLNRPERLNAITGVMLAELNEAFRQADDDPEVRVILLTGEGRGFCSGLDLKQAAAGEGIGGGGLANSGASHLSTRDIVTVTQQRIDTPLIAVINGPAAGYGADLAFGCDMRIMGDEAIIIPGFAKRGIVPESGGTWYLPRLLGWAKACEISFLAEDISAERAMELGLVNLVVPQADLMDTARDWATRIAANAPLAIKAMKRLFRHGLTEDFESHTHHVLLQLMALFQSNDYKEGVQSFIERREPKFTGS